jgi:hypothetical protein
MPPEGRGEEEQGVQARAPTAMTLYRWAQRTPCSAASDGRPTLGRPGHHAARGIGGQASPQPAPPCPRACVGGSPGLLPRQIRGRLSEAPALGRSDPPCRSRCRLRPPAPALSPDPAGPIEGSSPRPAAYSRPGHPSHAPYAVNMNRDFTIRGHRIRGPSTDGSHQLVGWVSRKAA